jgi:hypothetical protein
MLALTLAAGVAALAALGSETEAPVRRVAVMAEAAPRSQPEAAMIAKSAGCVSCHTATDQKTMHESPAIQLGCTDCHGGDAGVTRPQTGGEAAKQESADYLDARNRAHVLPLYPASWRHPSSANPERTYTLLNREDPAYIRFINPSDFRVAELACGACHQDTIEKSVRSMHATGAMLWGGAAYNNGILAQKNYFLGEAYTTDGKPATLKGPQISDEDAPLLASKTIITQLFPLPAWETLKPGDIFRVFERGGRNIGNLFPEVGLPNALGQLQRIEEPGRPDFRQSNRGPGTGARIAVPVINITKTRLNDPLLWFMGTNDQPGDYRHSGCAACHVVYANDRDPKHSSVYAGFGHDGRTITSDPTIRKDESGHPLRHAFTNSVPTSQCMVCHMHQPNMFMNTFLGYTMWDYESDAPFMWPEKQAYPTDDEVDRILDRNPEGAAVRGKWADVEFLKRVSELNPRLKDTQFADYHGHGWNFRAVFKRDREGNLLDAEGRQVADDDPAKFKKAVQLSSIHADKGMQCVDCHFSQDMHGNGYIYGEVAHAVEIDCVDCHGTATALPNLYTSGQAALGGGSDLLALRTPHGRQRFEWIGGELMQRSMVDPNLEWNVSLIKRAVTPGTPEYNPKAARAKLMSTNTATQAWGPDIPADQLAHSNDKLECYTCHSSWTNACGGCHLPIEANRKTERHHYEGGETRNFATYNPQVARDEMYLIGRRGPSEGGKYAPLRSSSALVLSSTNSNREKIYIQQPPIAASGFSSQAFNPHYPHTERLTETKTCTDCHVSAANDNNAIMAQLLGQGTNYINFVGFNAWVGGDGEVTGVQVTEWPEPQAVIGSYLHRFAYPDWYAEHQARDRMLRTGRSHSSGVVGCLQLRGEYLYAAAGREGFRAYDVASIANKGVSQGLLTAPFSDLGHDTRIDTRDATCVGLPTNQPIQPTRNQGDLMRKDNEEQPFHPIYNYAFVTDSQEGLIVVDVNTLADGEPRNNFLKRALTWNPDGILRGARHITIGGSYIYVTTPDGLVVASVDKPLEPRIVTKLPLKDPRATALQFRYLFVTDADGLRTVDVTNPERPRLVPDNLVPLADAQRVYVARTYAYVAAGTQGLAIVNAWKPEALKLDQLFDAGGQLRDVRDVIVASTNASAFAYLADGEGGLRVLQLTSPDSQPKFYGFSPAPRPELIASYRTGKAARSLSKGLDRDRAVDETGGQIAVFGRRGSRPLNAAEMRKLYLDSAGAPWFVVDELPPVTAVTPASTAAQKAGGR